MTEPSLEDIQRARKPLAFRLTLHSLDEMVNLLTPYYGLNCPIFAILDDDPAGGLHIRATLGTVVEAFKREAGSRRPFLVVG